MATMLAARDLAQLHNIKHETMIKRYLLGAAIVLVALAWLDVSTGVQLLDQLIHAVPVDWLRGLL